MRIIFVNRFYYPDISATSQMLYDLTRRMVQHDVEVHVVCSRQRYNDASVILPAIEIVEGVHVHRVSGTHFGRDHLLGRAIDYISFYLTAFFELMVLARSEDVLVAKTDPPLISVLVASVARWRGAHLVNWLQDLFPEVAEHLSEKSLPTWLVSCLRRLRDHSLRVALLNVAIGERMKEYVMRLGVAAESVCVIENWSDSGFVTPKISSMSQLRVQLGLLDKFVVGYSGNMGRAHEYETILNAAIELRNDPTIVFLMIGGGLKMQQLKEAVAQAGLTSFIFLPYQDRELLADSLAAADVHLTCLLPQLEGLIVPSKLYGILAAGRPTISIGDLDGEVARTVCRQQCGLAVQVKDHLTLVNQLRTLQSHAELRWQMGTRAHQLFISQYTADRAAQKWLAVFAELEKDAVDGSLSVKVTAQL